MYAVSGPRADLAATLIARLRGSGIHVRQATAWEDHDARIAAGPFVRGELLTSEHPVGCVQVRVRRKLRTLSVLGAAVLVALSALVSVPLCFVAVCAVLASAAWGLWRTGPAYRRVLTGIRP